jgi:hypothetical protein
MVLFGTDDGSHVYSISNNCNDESYLTVTTNIINNELLQSIDIVSTKNIIFQVPLGQSGSKRNIIFDFQVDTNIWKEFASKIRYLEFRGVLGNNQFNVKHLECMVSLKGLYIGSTNYNLFDNEDTSNLPMIKCISLNGYGMVYQSENMEKWLNKNASKGGILNCYC